MANLQKESDIKEYLLWRIRDIIRNRKTGHPYLVMHIYRFRGTEVADLEAKESPTPALFILPRDYDDFAEDSQLEVTEKKSNLFDEPRLIFNYNPVLAL